MYFFLRPLSSDGFFFGGRSSVGDIALANNMTPPVPDQMDAAIFYSYGWAEEPERKNCSIILYFFKGHQRCDAFNY